MQEDYRNLEKACSIISNLQIDTSQYLGQEIDQDIVEWYRAKFQMFVDDGCRSCIPIYLRKMFNRPEINNITRIAVGRLALHF